MMKVMMVIDSESNNSRTEMVGKGNSGEIAELIFQLDMLKFKLLRLLDEDSNETNMLVAKTRRGDGD